MSGHFISDQEIAGHFISDQKITGPEKVRIFSNMNGIYLVRTNQFHCILQGKLYFVHKVQFFELLPFYTNNCSYIL